MADITQQYRQHVEDVLKNYGSYKLPYKSVERQLVFDRERDHYQLWSVGWEGHKRYHGCVLHIDIKDNKIWIQHDGTEIGIANELVKLGVPREDIVLGFIAPYQRKYTDFADVA